MDGPGQGWATPVVLLVESWAVFFEIRQSSQCFAFIAIGEQAEAQREARLHLIMVIIH